MNHSKRNNNLPEWVADPKFVITVVMLFVLFVYELGPSDEAMSAFFYGPKPVPQCYKNGPDLAASRNEYFNARYHNFENKRLYENNREQKMRALEVAMDNCTVSNCPKRERYKYENALARYLEARARDYNRYYRHFGERGIEYMHSYYTNVRHDALTRGMTERLSAGIANLKRSPSQRKYARILMNGPLSSFGPCRISHSVLPSEGG